jgi:hypothetical protein
MYVDRDPRCGLEVAAVESLEAVALRAGEQARAPAFSPPQL